MLKWSDKIIKNNYALKTFKSFFSSAQIATNESLDGKIKISSNKKLVFVFLWMW